MVERATRKGAITGRFTLFSESMWRELTTLVTPIPNTDVEEPELAVQTPNFRGFALGLVAQDYRGRKMLTHTGGLTGYVSRVMMIPDIDLGISVLTNQESEAAMDAIAYRIADHYLAVSAVDWLATYQKVVARRKADIAQAEQRAATARNRESHPSLALDKYAGTYTDPWYGDIVVVPTHSSHSR